MADHYAYLEGGPCDKTRHLITADEGDIGIIVCKGGKYHFGPFGHRPDGDIIAKYAGKYTPAGTDVKAAHAHKGWADLRHTLNTVQPDSLRTASRTLAAGLRTTARARRVKIR